uniref:Macro domain-containing protein n=1 Tax=Neogobius melanostomus TaxID=47308 RepID=A0A8C6SB26_9GOBI
KAEDVDVLRSGEWKQLLAQIEKDDAQESKKPMFRAVSRSRFTRRKRQKGAGFRGECGYVRLPGARHRQRRGGGFGAEVGARGGASEGDNLNPREAETGRVRSDERGGTLTCRKIIHAVGPEYDQSNAASVLKRAVKRSLDLAEQHQCESVAVPAVSRNRKFPLKECAQVIVSAVREHCEERGQGFLQNKMPHVFRQSGNVL